MAKQTDFLDELISEGETETPGFGLMVEAALERRRLLRELAADRVELGLSQTAVAAEMGTSQSAVARIESGNADVKMSTVERYAATLGRRVQWRIASASDRRAEGVGRLRSAAKTATRSKKATARKAR
jgi:transcriptional regulator with XRE-family HTH domain